MKIFTGAIDLGGTKIASALVARDGELSAKARVPTDPAGGEAVVAQVEERAKALAQAAREAGGRLAALGVCVPGIVRPRDGTAWAPNIPGWDRVSLRDRLRKPVARAVPVVLTSDRSAYVAGESWRGAAAGARDAVYLAVGTGIGAGIISGGRIVEGHGGIAGAVGWFGLERAYKPEYAAMGSFEAEASGRSIARKARRALERGRVSIIATLVGGRLEEITTETVAEAARKKDPLALEIVSETALYLAMGIANIVSTLDPEVVVLGGGVFQAADVFLEPVLRELPRWGQPLALRAVRIVTSKLGEDAGLCGCGRLAWESLSPAGAGRTARGSGARRPIKESRDVR